MLKYKVNWSTKKNERSAITVLRFAPALVRIEFRQSLLLLFAVSRTGAERRYCADLSLL